MKKRLLLAVVASFALYYSCGDEPKSQEEFESLSGTMWKSERIRTESQWYQDELTFTDNDYSYIRRTDYGTTGGPFTGTYKFYFPTVTLQDEPIEELGETYVQPTYGTVKGQSMTVEVFTGDVLWALELKKQ